MIILEVIIIPSQGSLLLGYVAHSNKSTVRLHYVYTIPRIHNADRFIIAAEYHCRKRLITMV